MRKKIPKIIKSIFLIIFIFQMLGLIVMLTLPSLSQAADPKTDTKNPITFTPQVGIGDFTQGTAQEINENSIGNYISAIYKYAIGIVGIVAAVVLMMGGVIWLTAGGNQTRIGEAKAWIGASLTGLIIALTSYMILATVNPALVQFRPINVAGVKDNSSGCCGQILGNYCQNLAKQDCIDSVNHNWTEGGKCENNKCVSSSVAPTSKITGTSSCCLDHSTLNPTKCYDLETENECQSLGNYTFQPDHKCQKKQSNNIKECIPK